MSYRRVRGNYKPVLFEFQTYSDFVTGDKVGNCRKMNE